MCVTHMQTQSLHSCQTLCNPIDYSLPGSTVHGISQARILERVAISFSRGSSWPRDQIHVSCTTGGFLPTELLGKPYSSSAIFQLLLYCLRENAMATHSSTLAWEIPWTGEPGRLQSMGSRRVGHTERLHFSLSCTGEGNGNPLQYSCLENPRNGSLVGCHLWGRTESDTTDVT